MKARQLIDNAGFGPDERIVIGRAFDDAWDHIAPQVRPRPDAVETARLKLAHVVLSLAQAGGVNDSGLLTEAALKVMYADPTEL
jgi:hypothetical protein